MRAKVEISKLVLFHLSLLLSSSLFLESHPLPFASIWSYVCKRHLTRFMHIMYTDLCSVTADDHLEEYFTFCSEFLLFGMKLYTQPRDESTSTISCFGNPAPSLDFELCLYHVTYKSLACGNRLVKLGQMQCLCMSYRTPSKEKNYTLEILEFFLLIHFPRFSQNGYILQIHNIWKVSCTLQ